MNDIGIAVACFFFMWISIGIAYNAVRAYRWLGAPAAPARSAARPVRPPIDWDGLVAEYLEAKRPDPWDEIEIFMAMNERLNSTLH